MQQRILGVVLALATVPCAVPRARADIALTAAKVAKLKDKAGTADDQAIVKFVKEPALSGAIPSPLCPASSSIRLKSNVHDVVAVLDCHLWRPIGSGYVYEDKAGSHGGVRKVKLISKLTGGKLQIKMRGDQYGANPVSGPMVLISCTDVTNPPGVLGFSANGAVADQITMDADMDGFLDLNLVALFRPLSQPPLPGATIEIATAQCTTPFGGEVCSPDVNPPQSTTYTNQASGICLSPIAGTTGPNNSGSYSPAITNSGAPCFGTLPVTISFPFGLFTIPLQNVHAAAQYIGDPATQLTDGLLYGFLSESDANGILLPSTLPLIGGQPVSRLLPGGSGACPSHTAKDVGPLGQPGWYFYLNFTAHQVPWTGS